MRAAVLGSPVAHSLSPALHRAAYAALGLPWTYDAVECTAADLGRFLSGLTPEWAGLSLTMPLKQAVLPLLDSISDLARDVAAANTVLLQGGTRQGDNTDVPGMVAALREVGVGRLDRTVIVGGGATARSALAVARELGSTDITLVVRSAPVETLAAAARLGLEPRVLHVSAASASDFVDADLVISTLPNGAADDLAQHCVDVPLLLDVVYAPWPTVLARACRGTVVGGAAMLLHQAARQVELMTGQPAPLEAMRAALTAR